MVTGYWPVQYCSSKISKSCGYKTLTQFTCKYNQSVNF